MANTIKLPVSFYSGQVELLAPLFLGKILKTNINGKVCSGRIVEVEAYCGERDKACHAFFGKTDRNSAMFEKGGIAYVYLCYGIHHLFNIVVGDKNRPSAILVRALEPLEGLDEIRKRRGHVKDSELANGPGKLSKALGISVFDNRVKLNGDRIWIEKGGLHEDEALLVGPRIGVDYAGADKNLPWRFALENTNISVRKGLKRSEGGIQEHH